MLYWRKAVVESHYNSLKLPQIIVGTLWYWLVEFPCNIMISLHGLLNYSTVQRITLFQSGTSHKLVMVPSLWHHRMLHPHGLVPNLLGLRCQFRGDWSQRIATHTSKSDFNTSGNKETQCRTIFSVSLQTWFTWIASHEYLRRNESVVVFNFPGCVSIISAPGCLLIPLRLQSMATLKEGDQLQTWEFILIPWRAEVLFDCECFFL